MRLYLSILSLIFSVLSFGQTEVEFLKIPSAKMKTYQMLTDYLVEGQSGDSAKAVRIYKWITHNIAYENKLLNSDDVLRYKTATKVFKTKKAVCQGYSILLAQMLNHAGILATTVEGYTANFQSDSIPFVTDADHEWVAFRMNGRWYLADPTWDAGYVGRKPSFIENPLKRDKLLKSREEKIEKAKKDKKKARLTKRFEKKEKAYEEKKEKNRGKYSSEIGFVRQPALDYFMLDPEEFVKSHLPALPEFQLRKNPITINDFYKKTKSWDTIFSRKSENSIDFNDLCQIHAYRKLHDKWIGSALGGFEYNPLSYGTMALHHYNYLGVNLSEDARKQYEIIEKSDLHEDQVSLERITDSVVVYTKAAIKISKQGAAIEKKIFSKESKLFKASHKDAKSSSTKAVKAQEKTIKELSSKRDKTKKAIELLRGKMSKVLEDSPNANKPINYDISKIPAEMQGWKDSLFGTVSRIQKLRTTWDNAAHNPTLMEYRFGLLKYAYENSYGNLFYLNASTAYYSDSVVYYDSAINIMLVDLIQFHKVDYEQMYFPDSVGLELKLLEKQFKRGLVIFKKYGDKHINWDATGAKNYLNQLYFQTMKLVDDDMLRFLQDCSKFTYQEKQYKQYYEQLVENFEKEEDFKEKNIEYNEEIMQKNLSREQKMYKTLLEQAQKIKAAFKKVNG